MILINQQWEHRVENFSGQNWPNFLLGFHFRFVPVISSKYIELQNNFFLRKLEIVQAKKTNQMNRFHGFFIIFSISKIDLFDFTKFFGLEFIKILRCGAAVCSYFLGRRSISAVCLRTCIGM